MGTGTIVIGALASYVGMWGVAYLVIAATALVRRRRQQRAPSPWPESATGL